VEEPTEELNNEDADGEGILDADMPEIPKDVEDNSNIEEREDDLDEDTPAEDDKPWSAVTTRSGRSIRAP
jgi:hypothetical protein